MVERVFVRPAHPQAVLVIVMPFPLYSICVSICLQHNAPSLPLLPVPVKHVVLLVRPVPNVAQRTVAVGPSAGDDLDPVSTGSVAVNTDVISRNRTEFLRTDLRSYSSYTQSLENECN